MVSGRANGVDILGERWARLNNIPIKPFPADWKKHGKQAGYLRNVEMADYADAVICVWDGISRGTVHMMNIAKDKNMPLYILKVNYATT